MTTRTIMANLFQYDIPVSITGYLTEDEVKDIVTDEVLLWHEKKKRLGRLELTVTEDGQSIDIKAFEKSPIKRIRRITGYLSVIDNFNDAKRSELEERRAHI